MKIYSDTSVTKQELSDVDNRQSRQIRQLRVAVGGVFALNIITLILLFTA
jgi:hypothetical protein